MAGPTKEQLQEQLAEAQAQLADKRPQVIVSLHAVLAEMPEMVVRMGPDYRALREEKLGIPWDQDTDLTGVIDLPVPALPETPSTTGEVLIPEAPTSGTSKQIESSENTP